MLEYTLIFIRRVLHYFRTTIKVMNKIKTCIVIWLIVITAGLAGVMIFNYLKKLPGDCISMKPIPDISQLRQFFKGSTIEYVFQIGIKHFYCLIIYFRF